MGRDAEELRPGREVHEMIMTEAREWEAQGLTIEGAKSTALDQSAREFQARQRAHEERCAKDNADVQAQQRANETAFERRMRSLNLQASRRNTLKAEIKQPAKLAKRRGAAAATAATAATAR